MRVLRGVVYMTKSSGPRTEPRGTPQEEVCQDRSVSHFTQKQRDDRYDLNQLRTEPWIPNRVIKMSWSIESKAAERSSRQRHDIFCDPIAAVEAIVRIGWNEFRQQVPLLINKDVSLTMRGRLYSSCVRSSMLHGSVT